jgi:hypothetical protein
VDAPRQTGAFSPRLPRAGVGDGAEYRRDDGGLGVPYGDPAGAQLRARGMHERHQIPRCQSAGTSVRNAPAAWPRSTSGSSRPSVDVERTLKPGRYVLVSFYAGTGATAKPDIYRELLAATKVR